jgi:hypothetical protein
VKWKKVERPALPDRPFFRLGYNDVSEPAAVNGHGHEQNNEERKIDERQNRMPPIKLLKQQNMVMPRCWALGEMPRLCRVG